MHLIADQSVGLDPVFEATQPLAQILTPEVVVTHVTVQRSGVHSGPVS